MEKTTTKQEEKLIKDIQEYIEKNPIVIEYGYRDQLSKDQIVDIIKDENGIDNFRMELYDHNMDYIFEIENYFFNELIDYFKNDIEEVIKDQKLDIEIDDYFQDLKNDYDLYPIVDENADYFLDQDILCYLQVYSNYDCTNSTDDIDQKENYTSEVYKRVKKGIKKEDLQAEKNEDYTASNLIFPFSCTIKEFKELKENKKKYKFVTIPEGSIFGFYSNFNGSGSCFEKTTFTNLKLHIEEKSSKYDSIGFNADIIGYTLNDVYGFNASDFDSSNFKFSNK